MKNGKETKYTQENASYMCNNRRDQKCNGNHAENRSCLNFRRGGEWEECGFKLIWKKFCSVYLVKQQHSILFPLQRADTSLASMIISNISCSQLTRSLRESGCCGGCVWYDRGVRRSEICFLRVQLHFLKDSYETKTCSGTDRAGPNERWKVFSKALTKLQQTHIDNISAFALPSHMMRPVYRKETSANRQQPFHSSLSNPDL